MCLEEQITVYTRTGLKMRETLQITHYGREAETAPFLSFYETIPLPVSLPLSRSPQLTLALRSLQGRQ